jgi:hypothetical protein
MADLLERLKNALADHYAIERSWADWSAPTGDHSFSARRCSRSLGA